MQNVNLTNIRFKSTRQGSETGIEISFGRDNLFWSCPSGTDLADFDILLQYFIPDIDLERINYPIARWWERELYRSLAKCRQQRGFVKAFASFCEHIGRKYGKKKPMQSLFRIVQNKSLKSKMLQIKRCRVQG